MRPRLWESAKRKGPATTSEAVPRTNTPGKKDIHEGARRTTKGHEDGWTSFNHKRRQNASAILCPGCDDVMDDGFLGARASRPHQAWHSLGHLPHLDQPGTEPWLSFGLADAVPADRVAACSIALKLSAVQRDRMRAGRPRSQARPAPPCRADHSRKNSRSFMKMNHEWTRMNTNRPEDRWTSFNHKRHQNAFAILRPWGDDVMG